MLEAGKLGGVEGSEVGGDISFVLEYSFTYVKMCSICLCLEYYFNSVKKG